MPNSNLYAVILAGGQGTRFWPLSRSSKPKQFLKIAGDGTLFEGTLKRIQKIIPAANIFFVTNKKYEHEITNQIRPFAIPPSHILLEPQGKNTAPAICWAAGRIHRINPNATMAVLPSDHLILNVKAFGKILNSAFDLAQENFLVTLGIVPTRPDTGFGYLKTIKIKKENKVLLKVQQFTEKPSLKKARQFLKSKNYLWNSGMFIWKTETILEAFQKYLPVVYRLLGSNASSLDIKTQWKNLPSISVDYGILEKADNVVSIPAPDIGWSDVGSWEALAEVMVKDRGGNILKGSTLQLNCENTFVWGGERLISAIGLKNMIVIDTPDALLICRRDLSQNVKDIVSMLHRKKKREIL